MQELRTKKKEVFLKKKMGTHLWLRIHLSICRGHVFEPWSGKISHAAKQLSPCSTTTEPACCNYRSPSAYSPCSAAREATAMRSPHTHHNEE